MAKNSTKNIRERLFLLDGMALAYRAYFSFIARPLINSKGENTSAIFGFINALLKILIDEKPEHIAVVFDTKEPTFRHVMYEPYKATRQKMPDDLSAQIGTLKDVVRAFNVPCIELPGYEADDIMGTLARQAEKENIETYLVTGDKDFMQLISPLVKIYKPGKRGDEWEILDEQAVKTKFGVTPDKVIDVLGLIGDTSDNVPGVKGIGEKTAIPLVLEHGSIENILNRVDAITQKGLQQKLRDHRDEALLSKKLVTIETNVPLEINVHHLLAKPRDNDKLLQLFKQLEFKTLIKRLIDTRDTPSPAVEPVAAEHTERTLTDIRSDDHVYHIITSETDLKVLVAQLAKSKAFVFDTETTDVNPLRSQLIGIAVAMKPREAWYIPVKIDAGQLKQRAEQRSLIAASSPKKTSKKNSPTNGAAGATVLPPAEMTEIDLSHQAGLPLPIVLKHMGPLFSNPNCMKIGQNIKYDMLVFAALGVNVEGRLFDTMIANYVLRPDERHNLDALAAQHLGYKMISYDDLTGVGRERKELPDIHMEKIAEYSAEDADITLRLHESLANRLASEQLLKLCDEIEFPLIRVLVDMETAGIRLDCDYLAELSKDLERTLQNLVTDIYAMAGEEFNINSTQQLSKILFEKLKLNTVRKTKTGFSTDVWVLEELRNEHPVIERLLEYRQLQKLKSTYVDALPALVNPKTGRVHTCFNQTIAATGRLSSSNPNLQNIPIRTELGRSIRKAFVPGSDDMVILSADYSQIELRIMAHISGDEGLQEAFRNREDIHATTAAKVFALQQADISKDLRRKAKEVNFGIMYGIGPFGLSMRLGITQAEARELIARYFERFPKVKQYIADTLDTARRTGYVSTLLGRRRYFPDINDRNHNVRSNAERQAINMPIQGSAADMIKLAMIRIHQALHSEALPARMLLQVHDELVFEVGKNSVDQATRLIVENMRSALPLSIPVEVDAGTGNNWLEAH